MKFVDEFRDAPLVGQVLAQIRDLAERPLQLMEVCGTHTMAMFRHGLRSLMPPTIRLLSGPGCPVCVTPTGELDAAIALARRNGTILATFGDMMRVPGSQTTLLQEGALGRDVVVVYSPLDALDIAEREPDRQVVLFGVGFETTAPLVATTVLEATRRGLANFSAYSAHKLVPPALAALVAAPDVHVDGFICPGHVSTIIGMPPYEFLARQHGIGCAIAGFEPLDILEAILLLVRQAHAGEARVENAYRRAVRPEGNPRARARMEEAFEVSEAEWRGLGRIPDSGLALRPGLAEYDARLRFDIAVESVPEPAGCRCGDVLRGALQPADCALFGRACTPESPVGPCMVSSEGTCAAHYRYGNHVERDAP
jgi:hydrogenase expression/formation protein HypD